ncbi:PfkB family carbohydrate kinase [Amylibacter sp.]|nr:PfkB family carbohydrate kinase [Amylibacter sp.]
MEKTKIIVIGDVMLDYRILCDVTRISQEAPVPIALVKSHEAQLGGAANVALFLRNWFNNVKLVSITGVDHSAQLINELCDKNEIETLFRRNKKIKTTKKTRVVSGSQQLLRIDEEQFNEKDETKFFINEIKQNKTKVNYLILSDYDKGTLSNPLKLIDIANVSGIHTIIDPKGFDFTKYGGAYILKPNEKEACLGFGVPNCMDQSSMVKIQAFRKANRISNIIITAGEKGIILFNDYENGKIFTQERIDINDVTGAGDSVCASLAIGLTEGLSISECCEFGNLIGSASVKTAGNFVPNRYQIEECISKVLKRETKTIVFTNGCFDILHVGHLSFLKECSMLGDDLIIGINSDESVARLKGNGRPVNTINDRKSALEVLPFVSEVIVFDEKTHIELIEKIQPNVLVKGEDYNVDEVIGREIVEEKGGRVVILDFKFDISTSKIIKRIKN